MVRLRDPACTGEASVYRRQAVQVPGCQSELTSATRRGGIVHQDSYRLSASTNQLKVYKEAQDKDATCSRVKEYCLSSEVYLGLPSSVKGIPSFYVFTIHYPLATP